MHEAHWSLLRRFAGGELISREDIANNRYLSEAEIISLRDAFDHLETQLFIAADTQAGAYQSSKFKLTKTGKEAFDTEFNVRFLKRQEQLRWQFLQDPQPEIRETGRQSTKPAINATQEIQSVNPDLKKSARSRSAKPLGFYAFFTVVLIAALIISQDKIRP